MTVSLSSTEYIYTVQLVSLACLIEEYFTRGIEIIFTDCTSSAVHTYLNDIKFFDYWKKGFDRTLYTDVTNENCLCLWKVHPTMIDSYVDYAQRFAQQHWKEEKDFSSLHISLAELFNNIKDHSESEMMGYSMTQYHPTHNLLRISVCDFGLGIANSVNRFLSDNAEPIIPDEEAIKKAFELRFTVGSQRHNKGHGLNNVKDNVVDLSGTLNIYTNTLAANVSDKTIKTSVLGTEFQGTIVDVVIDIDSLYNLEEGEQDVELF